MNFVIIHFNTPQLTACLCGSVRKFHPDAKIIIFDNSTVNPFENPEIFCDEYIDNTKNQLINFETELSKYQVVQSIWDLNKCGSARHCITIQWLFDNLDVDEFVLLDSDILLTKPFPFYNSDVPCVCEHETYGGHKDRALPFICYFNLKVLKSKNIRYFDGNRMNGLSNKGQPYDTGASFLEDLISNKIMYKQIRCSDYIVHFKNGSWTNKNYISWLLQNKKYWD